MNPKFTTYEQIFDHYVKHSKELIAEATSVLKTDSYNEGFREPIATDNSIQLIEYKQEHIDKAKSRYPELNIVQGDIRNLPFKNNQFDLLLDLSTIDHIPQSDLEKVISEYKRVLTKKGKCLIITWFAEANRSDDSWNPDEQYYFDPNYFKELVGQKFRIVSESLLFKTHHYYPGDCELWQFELEAK